MSTKKNLRRMSITLNSKTIYHLQNMAKYHGFGKNLGRMIDEIVYNIQTTSPHPPRDNRCVCCGEIIPEGRQVCPRCERRVEELAAYLRQKGER